MGLVNLRDKHHITHINFAKGFRGGERQTLLLIKVLSERGFSQKIFTREKSELAHKLEGIKNLEIIRTSKPYILSLSKVKGTSIIHAHETKGAQFAYFANFFFKIPYLITRRVDNPIRHNFFNQKIYANSAYTIGLSNVIKKELLKISQNINIQIIPSAYSQLNVDPINVKKIQERFQNKFVIGHIGELDNAHKGQFYLIEAMKMLESTHPDIHLILLGKGKDEKVYKTQAKSVTNITFEGYVHNVGDYIHCFNLFVFPSLHEGLGSILFDIMQANVPIIATNTGGIPDIIHNNENGLLIPIKDVQAIYESIKILYIDVTLRANLASEALKHIDNYSSEEMANKYTILYQKVASR
ncbi:MAG: glycosyltransferase family 4 protein [Epsilonproteobacteria bacterium]|nr:glycosyltransferase family 4 protein [Campylobacterota bacterium]